LVIFTVLSLNLLYLTSLCFNFHCLSSAEATDIPAGSKGKLPDNSSADALSMAIESGDLI
jgi:hypothetical protein